MGRELRARWLCRKAREVKQQAPMQALPADLDEVQIEDLIAEFTGHLAIAPGAPPARTTCRGPVACRPCYVQHCYVQHCCSCGVPAVAVLLCREGLVLCAERAES